MQQLRMLLQNLKRYTMDNVEYNYSLLRVDYPNQLPRAYDKVRIICAKHGEFSMSYYNHKSLKYKCPFCRGTVPKGYWTLDNCKKDALKYKTKIEWNKKSSGAYTIAGRNKWIEMCCAHMNSHRVVKGYWKVKENVLKSAYQFNKLSEWSKYCSAAYASSKINGWYDECIMHFIQKSKPKGYWTFEKCMEEALKFVNKTDWGKKSPSSYAIAGRNKWIDMCCVHMKLIRYPDNYWTLKKCKEDAYNFKTRTEWANKKNSGYGKAKAMGWIDICSKHMVSGRKLIKWTFENCLNDAKNYKSKTQWENNSSGAVLRARAMGWYNECCKHMIRPSNITWTLYKCKKDALKYSSKTEWLKNSSGGYYSAYKYGYVNECCKHMIIKSNPYGFWNIKKNVINKAKKYSTKVEWQRDNCASYKSAKNNGWFEAATKHMKRRSK